MNRLILLVLTLFLACTGYEDTLESPSGSGVRLTAPGWPDRVPPGSADILVLHSGPLTGEVRIEPANGEGSVPAVTATGTPAGWTLTATGLLPDSGYTLFLTGMSSGDSAALPDLITNFRTAPGTDAGPPEIHSIWPSADASVDPRRGLTVVMVCTHEVRRGDLLLCLYGPGGYRYLAADETGNGTAASFTVTEPETGSYTLCLTGVRGIDGVYGSGIDSSFTVSGGVPPSTNAPPLLFSELCWQAVPGAAGSEFIELYNPSPDPADLAALGARLYRNSGSGWSLVCDFAGESHFSGTNRRKTVPGFGYLLITGDQGVAFWPTADLTVAGTRLTMTGKDAFALTRGGTPGSGDVLDLVSFTERVGAPGDLVIAPDSGMSMERKADAGSTTASMGPGGIDALSGNGWNSGAPSRDYVLRTVPEPRSSREGREIP